MNDFSVMMKKQRGLFAASAAPPIPPKTRTLAAPKKPPPSPPKKLKTSPLHVSPINVKRPNGHYIPLGERFSIATKEAFAHMRTCRAFDVLLVFLWVSMLIMPPIIYAAKGHDARLFGESPASAMFLLLLVSAPPLAVSFLRFVTSMRLHRTLRVDKVANAPNKLRQLAYTAHDPALSWWFWCGYVLLPCVAALNIVLVLLWYVLVGVSLILSLFIILLSIFTAAVGMRCTAWFYRSGIQSNYAVNIVIGAAIRNEWAAHCAQEARNRYFRVQDKDEGDEYSGV